MTNPSSSTKPAFQDPKTVWDDEAGHWAMPLTESSKIGFYTSKDLKTWKCIYDFVPGDGDVDLGTIECPNLY
jgi:levanbiose-producing levanase